MAVVVYWLLPRRARRAWLLVTSLVFYGTWNAFYVPAFLLLLVANFLIARRLAGPDGRRWLAVGIVLDLSGLFIAKYLDWVLGSGASIIGLATGRRVELHSLGIILPLAISFVTFTLIAYLVDVHRGRKPERRLLDFAVFVTFFPHLIAGPIMRAYEFLPQVHHLRGWRPRYLGEAAPLIVGGLLKKTIADTFLPQVDAAFTDPGRYSAPGLAIAAIAFTFQLYLDFSGYTDIALGSARLLGFHLPRNFDWPYRSTSMSEFWSRWHITLGRWLRDYLYFPLGGSRAGDRRAYLNLMITMTLCGLWHGAGLTYVVWGALQGVALCVNRWWRRRPGGRALHPLAGWVLTFAFVVFVRIFFNADGLDTSFAYLRNLVVPHDGAMPPTWLAIAAFLGIVLQWPAISSVYLRLVPAGSLRRWGAYGIAIAISVALLPVTTPAFIYFQF